VATGLVGLRGLNKLGGAVVFVREGDGRQVRSHAGVDGRQVRCEQLSGNLDDNDVVNGGQSGLIMYSTTLRRISFQLQLCMLKTADGRRGNSVLS
jgi:hypothetical protein